MGNFFSDVDIGMMAVGGTITTTTTSTTTSTTTTGKQNDAVDSYLKSWGIQGLLSLIEGQKSEGGRKNIEGVSKGKEDSHQTHGSINPP